MNKTLLTCTALAIVLLCACQNAKQNNPIPTQDTANVTIVEPVAPTDTSDKNIPVIIGQSLATILKQDLPLIPDSIQTFKFHAVDLNSDGIGELMVILSGSYFCGTGGCTAFLLDAKGHLLTRFTVVDFPMYVDENVTNGWKDLVIESKGKYYKIRANAGGHYPGNPSVQPEYKDKIPGSLKALLDIQQGSYPLYFY